MNAQQLPKPLPALRPGPEMRGKEYFDTLRGLKDRHGEAMVAEVLACKAARGGKITTAELITVILRYRLTLSAGFVILEDLNAIKAGTYDYIRRGIRPMQLLAQYLERHDVPEAAANVETNS